MVHHPEITSLNARCPVCELAFGYVEKDRKIECPGCHSIQQAPVILTNRGDYHCLDCRTTYAPDEEKGSACHECGAKPEVIPGNKEGVKS